MTVKTLKFVFASLLLLAAGSTLAQPGNGGGTYAGLEGSSVSPAEIVEMHVLSSQGALSANAKLFGAIGAPELAAQATAQAAALAPNSTRGVLEKALELQTEGGKALEKKIAGQTLALDAANSQQFSDGMLELTRTIAQYRAMTKQLAGMKQKLKTGFPAAVSALYLSKSLPGFAQSLTQTLRVAAEFAAANKVMVPAAVSEALAAQ